MTTITIERSLLERALDAIQELEHASTAVADKKARDAKRSIRAALATPATAPEKTVQEIMEFARHYAANTFSSATLEDKIRRSLAAPATAPERKPMTGSEIVKNAP